MFFFSALFKSLPNILSICFIVHQGGSCRTLTTPEMMMKKSLLWQSVALVDSQLWLAVIAGNPLP